MADWGTNRSISGNVHPAANKLPVIEISQENLVHIAARPPNATTRPFCIIWLATGRNYATLRDAE